ncbi:hypothetical protein HAX54_027552, partial [Datura stramonium]|nr:hypothetical protein [Datura stramonium]
MRFGLIIVACLSVFGIKEFAIMTGLNCHSPPRIGGDKLATKGEDSFNVLCARDVGKNIFPDWIKLSANYEAFNAYPWGREILKLTAEYLGIIPHLRHQVKDFSEKVSSPRILRWLGAKNNKVVYVDLFTPLETR